MDGSKVVALTYFFCSGAVFFGFYNFFGGSGAMMDEAGSLKVPVLFSLHMQHYSKHVTGCRKDYFFFKNLEIL
jgi:hypothetical protein